MASFQLRAALALAGTGCRVFPLVRNGKEPAFSFSWTKRATSNQDQIQRWWSERDFNIGIALDSDMLVVDVDVRDEKRGLETLRTIESQYGPLPRTFVVNTASGGRHLYYTVGPDCGRFRGNLDSEFGKNCGIDIKAIGGYVVGPGSSIGGRLYQPADDGAPTPQPAPDFLVKLATSTKKKRSGKMPPVLVEDNDEATDRRIIDYLVNRAEEAIEGSGGDNATIRVINKVGDMGASEEHAYDLLVEHWNETKAVPPWDLDDLRGKVASAYKSRQNPVGVVHPRAEFDAVEAQDLRTDTSAPLPGAWDTPANLFKQRSGPMEYQRGMAPAFVERFAADRARRLGVDLGSMTAATITTLGSLPHANNNLLMHQNSDHWAQKCVLWTALIGAPGTAKTPTISAAMPFPEAVERRWREEYAAEMREYEALSLSEAGGSKRSKKAKQSGTETAAPVHFDGDVLLEVPLVEPVLRRKIVHDATTEALGKVLADSAESAPVLLYCDELMGLIGGLDAYRARGGKDRPFFLQAKDGKAYSIDRATSGPKFIKALAVGILGGIQDDKLAKLGRELTDDGFWQRFAPVVMRKSGRGEDIPDDKQLDALVPRVAHHLVDLEPRDFRLSPEAALELDALQSFAISEGERFDRSASLKTWISKLPGEFGRYCLAFHLIEWATGRGPMLGEDPEPLVPAATAAMARRYVQQFLFSHSLHVYETVMAKGQDDELTLWVAGYILVHDCKVAKARDLGRGCRAFRGSQNRNKIKAVMRTLEMLGWVRLTNETLLHWKVNPAVHDGRFSVIKEAESKRRSEIRDAIVEEAAKRAEGAP